MLRHFSLRDASPEMRGSTPHLEPTLQVRGSTPKVRDSTPQPLVETLARDPSISSLRSAIIFNQLQSRFAELLLESSKAKNNETHEAAEGAEGDIEERIRVRDNAAQLEKDLEAWGAAYWARGRGQHVR